LAAYALGQLTGKLGHVERKNIKQESKEFPAQLFTLHTTVEQWKGGFQLSKSK